MSDALDLALVLLPACSISWVVGILCGAKLRVHPRDLFAATALSAWLPMWTREGVTQDAIARDAWLIADAMCRARGDND